MSFSFKYEYNYVNDPSVPKSKSNTVLNNIIPIASLIIPYENNTECKGSLICGINNCITKGTEFTNQADCCELPSTPGMFFNFCCHRNIL